MRIGRSTTRPHLGGRPTQNVLMILLVATAAATGQTPDLSGTWALVEEDSRIDPEVALTGLSGAGAPRRLHISQARNGTLLIESEINESHTRMYLPDGKTVTPVFLGQAGSVTVVSRWEDDALVSLGPRTTASDSGEQRIEERFRLTKGESETLELTIRVSASGGTKESRLVYRRAEPLGPCDSWESPCKPPAQR